MKQQVTKRYIQEAFRMLLLEKPMDKITVRDIVEECGLTRNTFYYHYDDIYDLFEDFLKEQLAQALRTSPQDMAPDEVLLSALGFLMEKPQVARHIFSSRNHDVMLQYMMRVTDLLLERHIALDGLNCGPEDRELILSICAHALYGMLEQWLTQRREARLEADLLRITQLFESVIHNALLASKKPPRPARSQEKTV